MPFQSPKSSQMRSKRDQKCLVGTARVGLGTNLTTADRKDAFTGSQAAHFNLILTTLGLHLRSLKAAPTSFPAQISLAKFNSQFVSRFYVRTLQVRHQRTMISRCSRKPCPHDTLMIARAEKNLLHCDCSFGRSGCAPSGKPLSQPKQRRC